MCCREVAVWMLYYFIWLACSKQNLAFHLLLLLLLLLFLPCSHLQQHLPGHCAQLRLQPGTQHGHELAG
jgi:hypothetical protein